MLFSLIMLVLKLSVDTSGIMMVYCNNTQHAQMVPVGVKLNIFCRNIGNLQDHMTSRSRRSQLTNMYFLPFIFNNGTDKPLHLDMWNLVLSPHEYCTKPIYIHSYTYMTKSLCYICKLLHLYGGKSEKS